MNEKVARALEVMKLLHDFDSVITLALLDGVRDHYSIPTKYELYALGLENGCMIHSQMGLDYLLMPLRPGSSLLYTC